MREAATEHTKNHNCDLFVTVSIDHTIHNEKMSTNRVNWDRLLVSYSPILTRVYVLSNDTQ